MIYDWEWLEKDGDRILLVKQIQKLNLEHWQTLLTEALDGFAGGQLKVLYEMSFARTEIGHTESLKLSKFTFGFGVDEIIFVSVVDNQHYAEKAKLFNMSAQKASNNVLFKHFTTRSVGEKWLFEYDSGE